jgi:hypothetical protein
VGAGGCSAPGHPTPSTAGADRVSARVSRSREGAARGLAVSHATQCRDHSPQGAAPHRGRHSRPPLPSCMGEERLVSRDRSCPSGLCQAGGGGNRAPLRSIEVLCVSDATRVKRLSSSQSRCCMSRSRGPADSSASSSRKASHQGANVSSQRSRKVACSMQSALPYCSTIMSSSMVRCCPA